jgi:serine/threonine protein kinase
MSLVGWRVEWKSSFRDYEGVVIEHTKDKVVVWEYRDLASYEWNPSQKDFKRWNPALKEFASYHRLKFEKLFPEIKHSEVCRRVISEIENIRNVPTILNAKKLALQIEQGKLESALIEEGNMEDDKDRTIEVHKNPQKTPRKLVECDFPEEMKIKVMNAKTRKEEESKKKGDDVDDNNERESSEEEDGEEDDDDDDEEDEEVEDDSEETESDDEDEEEDEEESDYEDKQVDIKIMILHTSQTRGFSVKLNSEGMKKILSKLQHDYSERISLFYRDDDGDVVNILSCDDLLYAYRIERKKLLSQSSSPEKNKKKNRRKSPTKPSKLKLFAELSQTDPMNPSLPPGHHFPFSSPPRTAAATQEITRRILNPTDLLLHHTASLTSSSSTIERRRERRGEEELEDQDIVTPGSLINNNHNEKGRSGTYDIIWKKGEVLGVGSFGKVFSGLNISNGMKMAIKEVSVRNHHNTKNSKLQVKALQREVAILARLDHPNIIKYLGTEFSDNTLRIFLEIATEGSLKDSLREFGAFPEPLIRCYANDIVSGLNYLHSCKIIHRDIKPANLLLSHGMVKLADFGCSSHSILHHPNAGLGETEHSTVTGTTIYMAPEVMQAGGTVEEEEDDEKGEEEERVKNHNHNNNSDSKQGEKDNNNNNSNNNSGKKIKYGRKADIWSLGMTLCELSTGNSPYKNGASAIYCVCVSKQLPSFPGLFTAEAHHFLLRCLTYEVEKRADAWELQEHVFLSPKVSYLFSLLFSLSLFR